MINEINNALIIIQLFLPREINIHYF